MGDSVKTIHHAAGRLGSAATVNAHVVSSSDVAKGAAAATTEAARFVLDRTFEAFEKATDPNYGAFWEPRVDRFSMIPWYERQLVQETCELPVDESPALFAMLQRPSHPTQRYPRSSPCTHKMVSASSGLTLQQREAGSEEKEAEEEGGLKDGASAAEDDEVAEEDKPTQEYRRVAASWHVVGSAESSRPANILVPPLANLCDIQSLGDVATATATVDAGDSASGSNGQIRRLVCLRQGRRERSDELVGTEQHASETANTREFAMKDGRVAGLSDGDGEIIATSDGESENLDEAIAEDEVYRQAVQCIAAPPLWREARCCSACRRPFGVVRYRHHCRACGGSFCHAHSSARKELPRLGFLTPVRVCDGCHNGLCLVEKAQRVQWRMARLNAYRRGELIPYFDLAVVSFT